MIRNTLLLLCFAFAAQQLHAQKNMELVGRLEYPGNYLSDIWGYTDDQGVEYAIVGLYNGTSIVSLANHSQPEALFFIPGDATVWRDMKVYGKHAYVTNEGGGGLLIIDLSALPASIETYDWNGQNDPNFPMQLNTAHNIYIDEKGYAYIFGGDVGNGGAIMLNLNANPTDPPVAGIYDTRYVHDGFVRGDTLWAAEINTGTLSVVDVSNKMAPAVMGLTYTPGNTAHNCWLSDNGRYLFTTDEISDGYIAAYDVSDVTDIVEVDRIRSSPGQNVIPHNAYVVGDYVLTAYYRDGVTIHDAAYPGNMVQVGGYDTSPAMSGNGFNGCWGLYPYFGSGYVIATDIEQGLFVLDPTYIVPAYGNGTITDVVTGQALPDVNVEVHSGAGIAVVTDFDGSFSFGVPETGFYEVSYDLPGYMPAVFTVYLLAGELTDISTSLIPDAGYTLLGRVVDASTGAPLPNVPVLLAANGVAVEATSDNSGDFSIPGFLSGLYDISVGKWGYVGEAAIDRTITSNTGLLTIEVQPGYYDDFNFDLGWTADGTANSGLWERGLPNGTSSGGEFVNPPEDAQGDVGGSCYVTGNAGGSVGADDVDDGTVVLTSPVFDLAGYGDPYISYRRWFVNTGGSGTPNDTLFVYIDNGVETALLESVGAGNPTAGGWAAVSFSLLDYIDVSENMTIRFATADDAASGHLVEAGVDVFEVTDGDPFTGVSSPAAQQNDGGRVGVSFAPNPFIGQTQVTLTNADGYLHGSPLLFKVFSLNGKLLRQEVMESASKMLGRGNLPAGMYVYVLEGWGKNVLASGKLSVGGQTAR